MVPTLDRAHCLHLQGPEQSRAQLLQKALPLGRDPDVAQVGGKKPAKVCRVQESPCKVRILILSFLWGKNCSDSTEQQDQVRFTEQKKYCVTKVQRISISPSISSERRSQVVQNRSNDRRAKKGLIRCRKGGWRIREQFENRVKKGWRGRREGYGRRNGTQRWSDRRKRGWCGPIIKKGLMRSNYLKQHN